MYSGYIMGLLSKVIKYVLFNSTGRSVEALTTAHESRGIERFATVPLSRAPLTETRVVGYHRGLITKQYDHVAKIRAQVVIKLSHHPVRQATVRSTERKKKKLDGWGAGAGYERYLISESISSVRPSLPFVLLPSRVEFPCNCAEKHSPTCCLLL